MPEPDALVVAEDQHRGWEGRKPPASGSRGTRKGWRCLVSSPALPVAAPPLLLGNAPKSSLGIFFLVNRDSPVVKGNALLALSSLAVVVSRHEASLSSDSEGVLEVSKAYRNQQGSSCVSFERRRGLGEAGACGGRPGQAGRPWCCGRGVPAGPLSALPSLPGDVRCQS